MIKKANKTRRESGLGRLPVAILCLRPLSMALCISIRAFILKGHLIAAEKKSIGPNELQAPFDAAPGQSNAAQNA